MAEESNAMFYNVNNLKALAEELENLATNFSSTIDTMYEDIYGMETNNYWTGATYDQFKNMCDTFKTTKIKTIITKLHNWSKGFASIAEDADTNTTTNKALFDEVL